MGYFDLDPNRACALVLEAFAAQPANDAFMRLLPAFSADAVAQLLGFQCARHAGGGAAPEGMYTAAAKLVRDGHVALEALLAHLSPADEELAAQAAEGRAALAQAVKRIGVISLTGGGDDAADAGGAGTQLRRTGQTAAALLLDPLPFAAHLAGPDGGACNQRLCLLAGLLRAGAWEQAVRLMRWLAALGVSDVGIYPVVGAALCSLVAAELAPQYARLHPRGVREEMASGAATAAAADAPPPPLPPPQLSDRLLELLRLTGHHLYHDVATLTRVVRVVRAVLASAGAAPAQAAAALEVLTANVLPAASLLPGNAALALEVWAALGPLPYPQRFSAYGDLAAAAAASPLLTAAAKLAETEVRRVLRRVVKPTTKREARTTMRPLGRMLAKIAHAAPLPVAEQLLSQVMYMAGLGPAVAEALAFLTPHAFDVLTFAVLRQLSAPKRKLKEDGVNLEEWVQALAAFTGALCKKHE
jgi:THO complex subunit 2